jgi:hypothetical protein
MNIKSRTLTTTEEQVLGNDLLDIQAWVDGAINGKINNCKKRMLAEWQPKLLADPAVTSLPATEEELIALIVARSDYKNATTRVAEDQAGMAPSE